MDRQEVKNHNRRTDFCPVCRKETEYTLRKEPINVTIRDRDYTFKVTVAVCSECGSRMDIPKLLDANNREIDEQYRREEELVSVSDIKDLMDIYQIGKAPLSCALGFGEVTISRYLRGQMPSREYSDIMKSALNDPAYMEARLRANRDKIAETAYRKSIAAVKELKEEFRLSEKLIEVIAYIFRNMGEVTPLALQKLLYYIQALALVKDGKEMFPENCQAWIHGPVYPNVYRLFKDFKYNPIDDPRFSVLRYKAGRLSGEEQKTVNLVLNSFGVYSGKILERITHRETPWMDAREGCLEREPSHAEISKNAIKQYFQKADHQYHLNHENGIKAYISDMLTAPSLPFL